ncbi:hypothetical protein VMT65_24615 [Nocardia sp. CDC153]|uniref:hypothetical protein n=1 Tax=Nocardia sp. CDC153 TaxID=3112167 RepID=UPI002DB89CF2|nr:hypothetical protein [Nocardia sp. CDC153]MEC3956244.1 hypothetical protein [Nocardia sp. CDC153]
MTTLDRPSLVPTALPLPDRRLHRPLLVTTAAMAALALFSLCAMAFDDRMLLGESVWLKPLKFATAFTLYCGTLAWLLSFPHRGRRLTWWMGTVFAATGVVDVGFIVLQAARGTFSHFNGQHDAVNDIGQQVFASGVPGLFLANLVIAVTLSWQRVTDRPTSMAIRAGLGIAVFGMALGYTMGFSGKQQTTDAYGHPVTLEAGHTFMHGQPEVRDGVAGMPVTHWSTAGGDMRVAHFAGLHGIQLLIVAAIVLARLAPSIGWLRTERTRTRLIGVLALGYTGVVATLLWQALRAQPVTRPDGETLTAFGLVAALTALGVGLVYALSTRERVTGRHAAVSAAVPPRAPVPPMSR